MLHELRGHSRITPILSAHPTDRRLAMSAARDGRVCLWDIERGKLLNSFTNILETTAPCQDHVMGNPVDFADGHFSPSHGWGIALADACGRVVLLGVDSEERYVNVEKEQYWQVSWQSCLPRSSRALGHELPLTFLFA
jgi:WD40 repeat protein